MLREIRKITTLHIARPLSFHFREGKFMIFRKHGGNWYGNFLRHTFDKVREVTRLVCIVWLLRCCSCSETLTCGASFLEDTKVESRAKFHFHGGTRSKPYRAIGDERDIFFRHGHSAERWRRGCYLPTRNFLHYVNLRAKWTARTKQRGRV